MSDSPQPAASLTFEGELPLPEVNVVLYRRIYFLEQWLRRIALAVLMARYGPRWGDAIPTSISKNARPRLEQLKNRVVFDTENADNLLWSLTLDELRAILVYDKLWPTTRALTSYDRSELHARLDELREIRNIIGHNRAATSYTARIFSAISDTLSTGIAVFRDRLLYDFAGTQQIGTGEDPILATFYSSASPLGRQHMGLDEYFYYLYAIPEQSSCAISLSDMLDHFAPVQRCILSFLINRQTLGEYTLVWPRIASEEEHRAVLDCVAGFAPRVGEPYELQSPKLVCHPKIWFAY